MRRQIKVCSLSLKEGGALELPRLGASVWGRLQIARFVAQSILAECKIHILLLSISKQINALSVDQTTIKQRHIAPLHNPPTWPN